MNRKITVAAATFAALVALAACGRADDTAAYDTAGATAGAMATPPATPGFGATTGATVGATVGVDTPRTKYP